MFSLYWLLVDLSVCLSKLWMNVHEMFGRGGPWDKEK